jgi:hypothetical protein
MRPFPKKASLEEHVPLTTDCTNGTIFLSYKELIVRVVCEISGFRVCYCINQRFSTGERSVE